MSKRTSLHLILGGLTGEERRIYRLREARLHHVPAQEPWPEAGAWRDLVRKLMRNPVKGEKS